jgi:hypothetical protein
MFVFLANRAVPPTNNGSEQALRPCVVFRKVTNCFRSEWAAHFYADIRSIIETARRRAIGVLDAIRLTLNGQTLATETAGSYESRPPAPPPKQPRPARSPPLTAKVRPFVRVNARQFLASTKRRDLHRPPVQWMPTIGDRRKTKTVCRMSVERHKAQRRSRFSRADSHEALGLLRLRRERQRSLSCALQ